ncbi:4-(cytidine 5'-diphospho)-2-C-methyl-D-erythritol kinase [Isoptericola sp. b441]|uniref:4-diphosphocytidyl-2-C-methyl-D-erythritol kinase n=1 Tax=Actinotalea lenta TaxID=3064654 RepID=A0ABT9D7F9_9CELL|nr:MULTISPECIES: 4-(cytidine 5'-diphospho)-2-C-methyl-D-erythritol kinase [unclassified Isoptericola]MDO8106788.1 4-(cytidine 5'-diphospho)-2-C-methyl-D-erythritol kinase [Isoptericola sp. b441]MDO8121501.1 4-(cytidine 5'-diphospho)-2-C-methyl-D-erythritol kinase [Isoptericola sp. b490]
MSIPDAVTVRAPGKLNLSLGVGRRRPDGFHPLATVFQAVSVYEEVTATAADAMSLTVEGADADRVPTDESNLAWRAALLVAQDVGMEPLVRLHVRKRVPVAGGMAGGSADAAAALLACDALWGAGLSKDRLVELAAELGSDVPFVLLGHTAVGTQRGDLLSPALCRGRYHWALATRRAGLSTADVYRRFDELVDPGTRDPEPDRDLLVALRAADLAAVGRCLGNDLQAAALELAPELERTLDAATRAGALGAVVTGSGPTVAALGRSRRHATELATAMRAAGEADQTLTVVGPVAGARAQ